MDWLRLLRIRLKSIGPKTISLYLLAKIERKTDNNKLFAQKVHLQQELMGFLGVDILTFLLVV